MKKKTKEKPKEVESDIDVNELLTTFETLLSDVSTKMEPLFDYVMNHEKYDNLSAVQHAKINMCIAYSINSLYYSMLNGSLGHFPL